MLQMVELGLTNSVAVPAECSFQLLEIAGNFSFTGINSIEH